jgi:hypothetical protein
MYWWSFNLKNLVVKQMCGWFRNGEAFEIVVGITMEKKTFNIH